MTETKETDKRTIENQRVKKAIEEALFALLKKKRFSEITVSDIVRESGVARASYYRNFDSKEAIIESYMDRQRREVAHAISFTESFNDIFSEEKLVAALEHYLRQRDDLLALYDNGFGTFLQEDTNRFAELCLGDMPHNSIERYNLYFISGAMFNTTVQWLKGGAIESPRVMARAFLHLLSSNIASM
ncbi:MAG TPA: TetR/AcrR family transcriptional regulator [Feifaniaceae bacterium]|nr:TetR/AcrR family transcriptional regulator [Feifaniaceae bacterium]